MDRWLFINNSKRKFINIASGSANETPFVEKENEWQQLKKPCYDNFNGDLDANVGEFY